MLQEKKKGVRVIYILHKTLSPLKMDAAEPTGDRRLELTSAAGTGSLREEECGILVRGRLYNPLQRIFIYITRDRKMQDEVRFLKLTGSFNSKCYTQSTRFLKKKGRKKKEKIQHPGFKD